MDIINMAGVNKRFNIDPRVGITCITVPTIKSFSNTSSLFSFNIVIFFSSTAFTFPKFILEPSLKKTMLPSLGDLFRSIKTKSPFFRSNNS